MAGNIQNKYGGNGQAVSVTLASLASGSKRASTAVDNSTNVYTDSLLAVKVKSGASGVSSTGYVDVYAYGTVDGGTTYSGGCTGTDAAFSGQLSALFKLGRIAVIANATTYPGGPWSVASAFGGSLPDHWGICIDNESGAALDSTEGNHLKLYQGVEGQYT
jgi:hypothetical protein